jgi:hypothetical protein
VAHDVTTLQVEYPDVNQENYDWMVLEMEARHHAAPGFIAHIGLHTDQRIEALMQLGDGRLGEGCATELLGDLAHRAGGDAIDHHLHERTQRRP